MVANLFQFQVTCVLIYSLICLTNIDLNYSWNMSIIDETKKTMTPKTEKCYKIHGFTARENIPMEYWLSDGTYVIVPANEV